jgi:hypothetical protein
MIHIHNGDAVLTLAKRTLIPGEHVAYRESLVSGPVVPGPEWIETRARAIAEAHDQDLLRVRTGLLEQEQMLDNASNDGEVVLWFEHDLYCLIHLVHLLQRLDKGRVSVVWSSAPLTSNDEHELYMLFESRSAVTPSMARIAREVWTDYISSDPTSLNRWLERDSGEFPFLREGLLLHASRFPSVYNGVGTIEQRALEMIAAGTTTFGAIFDRLNTEVPRFGFGDGEVFRLLRSLAWRAVPLLTLGGEPPKALFAITPAGMNVISGEVDDTKINDPDLWFGGAHLTKEKFWRWDDRERRIV